MTLNIKTTNISLTPETKEYLERKLAMLGKIIDFENGNVYAQVELGKTTEHHKQGDIFRAEINLRMAGRSFRAVSEKQDLYAAIDAMKDELGREVKSGKDKKVSLLRRGGQRIKKMLRIRAENETY
jgi:ribosomal subunit interface protein